MFGWLGMTRPGKYTPVQIKIHPSKWLMDGSLHKALLCRNVGANRANLPEPHTAGWLWTRPNWCIPCRVPWCRRVCGCSGEAVRMCVYVCASVCEVCACMRKCHLSNVFPLQCLDVSLFVAVQVSAYMRACLCACQPHRCIPSIVPWCRPVCHCSSEVIDGYKLVWVCVCMRACVRACVRVKSPGSPRWFNFLQLSVYYFWQLCPTSSVCPHTLSYGLSHTPPLLYGTLPQQILSSDSVSTFRSRTQTHLFRLAF